MKIKRFNQHGAIDLVLILVVAVLAIGLGGYVRYQQIQTQKAEKAASGGVIVSKHAKKATSKSTSSQSLFAISEFKVQGKLTTGVTLQYVVKSVDGAQVAYFTSAELLKAESGCTAEFGPGGAITQYTAGSDYHGSPIESISTAKKVGSYYYIYDQPQAYCSKSAAYQPMETTAQAAVKNLLATLEAK